MLRNYRVLFSLLMVFLLLGSVAAFASSEPEVQVWETADVSPTSSYTAPDGAMLAFVSRVDTVGENAVVDIYVEGILYENVSVTNYTKLLTLAENSSINGKKAVHLTGVMEYSDFDADAGTVVLYNSITPNDNVVWIPDEATAQTVKTAVEGLFSYGTNYGVEAIYTFDHGYGLYVDGFITPVADGCAWYGVTDEGLIVLDNPTNAIYSGSALAQAGLPADYSLAVTERNNAGEITAVYYTNVVVSVQSEKVELGLEGNAAVSNGLIEEYDQYLDYDYNGFTATSDTAETATYLYTDAATGVDASGEPIYAYADGALNTYESVHVDAIDLDEYGIIHYEDGSEYANGKAVAYATNGGLLAVEYINVENAYSIANGGILGALESGSISWGLSQESGYNSVIFATNGGKVIVGDQEGERSYLRAYGHIANGVFATGTGLYDMEDENTTAGTAEAYIYNTDLWVDGWNGHITDATRGGFIYLENVEGYSGYPGSMLGNGSGLTTDTGDGMVIAKDSHIEVFGMGSAGMYIIGSNSTGLAENCTLRSWVDAGVVSASGGHIICTGCDITGMAGFRNRGGASGISTFENCSITASNAYSGTVTLFAGKDHEQTVDFSYNWDFTNAEKSTYVSNIVGDETLSIFEMSLPGSIYRNTMDNTSETALYDNLYCGAGGNGYNGIWSDNAAFDSPCCWSTGESASYVTCFEFESSSITLDLINNVYDIDNTFNDAESDKTIHDFDFLVVSEFGSSPTLNFIDHDTTITGIIYNEGYTETHKNMGMPTKDESALTVNFENSDFIGVFCDGDLGLWETDVTYTNTLGVESNLNGNYFCGTPNGKGVYSFDENSVWYVWSDSYVGSLTLADESCVESYDGQAKYVYVCNSLNIGDKTYTEGESVAIGNVIFTVESAVFGQEPAPWTGEYTVSVSVVADDAAAAAATKVSVPARVSYNDEFDIEVEMPDGYDVVYVTACGKILGAAENVKCTASFSIETEGVLYIEVAVAPVEGSDIWQYQDNADGSVTIIGSTKYSQDTEHLYCIVPAELDGKPVTGFGDGADNVLYRSELYAICFQEGIKSFGYQALYDLNSCFVGILPGTAQAVDAGFVRSMPVVTWGIHAASSAAQSFVEEAQYSFEYVNTWEEDNITALDAASGSSSDMASGEAS